MRARKLLIPAILLSLSSGCAATPPPLAAVQSAQTGPDARRADIHRQLAPLCPAPLSGADLSAAADLVEAYPRAAPVVGRAYRMHREARICRGLG